ncbi:MAG: tetratricopeptide repeat protein [Polyangiales bacterium]
MTRLTLELRESAVRRWMMNIPPHLETAAENLKEGERFVAVSGVHGTHCFRVTLRGVTMGWENFPDDFHQVGRWAFGDVDLPPAHATEFAGLFDSAMGEDVSAAGMARQELSLMKRENGSVSYRRFETSGRVEPSSPASERLASQCSNQVRAWAAAATLDNSYLCFATNTLGPQWIAPESVMLIRCEGTALTTVRRKLAELGEHAAAVESLAQHQVAVESRMTFELLSARPAGQTKVNAFMLATRRGEATRVVQSETSNAEFTRLFDALSAPDAEPDAPEESALATPERVELERRLGGVYKLDGSFASLWAVEEILKPIRRAPGLAKNLDWVAEYLADLFQRAFEEMKMKVDRETATKLVVTAPIRYRLDTAKDLERLIRPPKALPTFHGIRWLGGSGLGSAMVPWYGLSTIFQNNSWAETNHDMIGRQRDRMDRAVPWLCEEHVRGLDLAAEHHELARKVARWMVWPPLGYSANDHGEHNLPKLRQIVEEEDATASRTVLDAFVAGQDRAAQLLAAATSIHFAIPPDTRHEAMVYRDAVKVFRLDAPPFIRGAISEHGASMETPNVDADHPKYAAVYSAEPRQGVQLADLVLKDEPDLPTFLCSKGRHLEALRDTAGALACYDRAIALKPDYVLARINRGSIHSMQKDFVRGDADFFAAREVRPEDADLRGNLILNHHFAKGEASTEKPNAGKQIAPAPAPSTRNPPPKIGGRERAGLALRELLRRFAAKEVDQNAALRGLMSYQHYLVPGLLLPPRQVAKKGLVLSETQAFPPGELWVFTDAVAATRAQAVHATLGVYAGEINPVQLLGYFDPRKYTRLWVNPKGPQEECFIFTPGAIGLLHAWATGLSVERAASRGESELLRASMSHHPGLLVASSAAGKPLLTRLDSGELVAHVAATIDKSGPMSARLGSKAMPAPPGPLRSILARAGATGFQLEGVDGVFSLDVLG